VEAFDSDEVTWADGVGDTNGEAFYRAAADAVTNSIFRTSLAAAATSERPPIESEN
jgi:hypothetical protein